MPEIVMARFNTLGGNQPNIFTITDRHGCFIGEVETPGVCANSDEGEVEIPGMDAELEK